MNNFAESGITISFLVEYLKRASGEPQHARWPETWRSWAREISENATFIIKEWQHWDPADRSISVAAKVYWPFLRKDWLGQGAHIKTEQGSFELQCWGKSAVISMALLDIKEIRAEAELVGKDVVRTLCRLAAKREAHGLDPLWPFGLRPDKGHHA